MRTLIQDLRFSFRILFTHRGSALVAILTLALGIGACTAIFTVVHSVLIRSLPFSKPEKIVQLMEISGKGNRMNVPEQNFADWREQSRSFEHMAMYNSFISSVSGVSEPVRVRTSMVSRGFFETLGVKALIGRTFLPEESRPGAPPAVVVSYGFWQRYLGGDPHLAGRSLTATRVSWSIVGVLPPGISFPPGTDVWASQEALGEPVNPSRSAHNWSVIARLRPGVTPTQASGEISLIAKRIQGQYSDVTAVDATAIPLAERMTERVRYALIVLLGAVGLLLLIACANVANLLLAQAAARRTELAVRAALGAGRGRLVRQFMTESLVLSLVGGTIGVVLASVMVDALLELGSGRIPRIDEIRLDGWVLAFAFGLSTLTALILGVAPAWHTSGANLHDLLKEGGRGPAGSSGQNRLRGGMVVAQVGMTIVLLVGAGLMARSFLRLLQVDLGFGRESRLAVTVTSPQARDEQETRKLSEFNRAVIDRAALFPGVEAVGGINSLPLTGGGPNGRFLIEEGGDSKDYWPGYLVASPGYFGAMGIPLLRGRLFDATDGPQSTQVALISRDVAERVWPGEDPIGRRINTGNMDGDPTFMTIVGIVGDVRHQGPEAQLGGAIYVHYQQRPAATSSFTTVVRTAGDPDALIPQLRREIQALNPELPVRFQTLEQALTSTLADRRFNLVLLLVFGGAAMLIALIGLYGVVAYSVARRTQEIGIRIALGARSSDVVRQFVGEGVRLIACGLAIGIAGSLALGRVLSSLLFEIPAQDPITLGAAAICLSLTALAACYLPARRASRVDPMRVMR